MINRLVSYLKDPFGRKEIEQKHDPIIKDLRKEAARLQERRQFPIASTVSYHRYRLRQGVDRHA